MDKSSLPDFVPAAARARIAQLELGIHNLQGSAPEALLLEREKLHQELADYKYPVLTLPPEITAEIFIQFLPAYPERPALVGRRSPTFLLRICRAWRDVALSTPALWSTMSLSIWPLYRVRQQHLLDVWLQRSGSRPLSIDVKSAPFMEAILAQASRWQDMEIFLRFDNLRLLTGSMPLLRSLKLSPAELLSGSPDSEPRVALFMQAPNLEDITVSQSFSPFRITLPWSQLTTITASPYVNEAAEMLRNTPRLVDCTLLVYDWSQEGLTAIPPLLNLRQLKLQYEDFGRSSGNGIRWLFKALTLPSLEVLRVSEDFLGTDHIAALSGLRPKGYPSTMEITRAVIPHSVYAQAFPDAQISIRLGTDEDSSDELDETDSEETDESESSSSFDDYDSESESESSRDASTESEGSD